MVPRTPRFERDPNPRFLQLTPIEEASVCPATGSHLGAMRSSGNSGFKGEREIDAPGMNVPLTFELKLEREHPWFAEIGLLSETRVEFGLGYCSKGITGGRVAFPIHDPTGRLIGYAGRWPGERPPEG